MNIVFADKKLKQIDAGCEVILVVNKKLKHAWVKDAQLLRTEKFKGQAEEMAYFSHKKRLYLGVASADYDELRNAMAAAVRFLGLKSINSIKIGIYGEKASSGVKALAEGALLGAYSFQLYKSKKKSNTIGRIIIANESYQKLEMEVAQIKQAIKEAQIISQAVNNVRDIVNQAPADITPIKMASLAKDLAKDCGLQVMVHGEAFLKKEGMGAFLAVSQASPYPPQLIHLTYRPQKSAVKAKVALVGKGLTYDSGGLSIKPSNSMLTMKSDKSGGSAILGIMRAVSDLELPIELHGIIGATENMVGQNAFKPDDVVKAKNGKTIEIKNTDAEGRLVLADCLVYAQEQKPDYIIDIATLTGACVVALGEYTIGLMGYDKDLKKQLKKAAEHSGELISELPFNKYLPKLLKSEMADISNISSGSYGGAITAALFLSEFITKQYKHKWAHLDIAGPAYLEKVWGYNSFGASGASVRLLINWLQSL